MTASALIAAADRCVRCGLCLPHCPTYRLTANEAESPRGRIAIARTLAAGGFNEPASADLALDHCLGCRRCEVVCPAQVEYAGILLQTRFEQRRRRGVGWRQRVLEWLCARPFLFDLAARTARLSRRMLPRRWRPLFATAPRSLLGRNDRGEKSAARGQVFDDSPAHSTAMGQEPAEIMDRADGFAARSASAAQAPEPDSTPTVAAPTAPALFRGCVARGFDAGVEAGLRRLLDAAGSTLLVPEGQTCCGAIHLHAGNRDATARLRTRNRTAFAGHRAVLCTASGCHAALADTLGQDAVVRDPLEWLDTRRECLHFKPTSLHVGLHIPCTQASSVGSAPALRRLLAAVPRLKVSELTGLGCCGAAGTHMLVDPKRAMALRRPLLDEARAAGVDVILSANIGCRLHLTDRHGPPVQHPLEFLARLLP